MRKVIYGIIFLLLAFYVISIFLSGSEGFNTQLKDYYLNNFYADTYALNCVSAIYLNYRVYDSIFETMILLASTSAVICFSRNKED